MTMPRRFVLLVSLLVLNTVLGPICARAKDCQVGTIETVAAAAPAAAKPAGAAPAREPAGGFGMWGAALPKAAAPDYDVLTALTAKAAAIRDYHYRVEWATAGGVSLYTAKVSWVAGEGTRIAAGYAGHERPMAETFLKGDEAYSIALRGRYEVTKSQASKAGTDVVVSWPHTMFPAFLSTDVLAFWQRAEVKGTEAVGGVPCHIVDVTPTDARLWGDFEHYEGDFTPFIPHTGELEGSRFWVDAETGMVRRWGLLQPGHARKVAEVMETQEVDGFLFPAVVTMDDWGTKITGQITEATVNQGIEDPFAGFRPPRNWLVNDETVSLAQVRERLQANPDDANLHYTLGTLYEQRGRKRDAAREFRRAAKLAPDSPSALFALGLALRLSREDGLEEAIEVLRKAVQQTGGDSRAGRRMLADALRRAGKTDDAIAEYRQLAAAGGPLGYMAVNRLAGVLAGKGDFEGAYQAASQIPLSLLETSISEVDPVIEWATKAGNLDDLRTKAEQALAADPESGAARLVLAKVLQAQGDNAQAAEVLRAIPSRLESMGWRQVSEAVSLAQDLGEEELVAQLRQTAIREAIESGNTWPIRNLCGVEGQSAGGVSAVVKALAALWAEAADAQARATLLSMFDRVLDSIIQHMYRGQDPVAREVALARTPEEMTPAECAIVGELARRLADIGGEREAKQAAACLQRALIEWPDDGALWAKMGMRRWHEEAWDEAAEAYRRAATADADQIEYPARAAFALVRLGRCEDAIAAGRETLQRWGDEWAAKAFFGSLQIACGQFEAARDAFVPLYRSLEAERSSRGRVQVGRLLARCHERLGEIEQAGAILKQEVAEPEESPSSPFSQMDAYRRLIRFYARHGKRDDVYPTARELYALADDESWARELAVRAVLDAFGGDKEVLTAALRADLDTRPGDIAALEFAAAVCEAVGFDNDAVRLLREAAEEANDAEAWIQLADVAESAEDGALLAEALRRAAQLKPDDRKLRLRYARAASAQGDTAPAKALADEARAKADDSPDAWREVAEFYLVAQSWGDALAAAERVLALAPETDEPARMRGQLLAARAYAGKRDDHEARQRLMRVLARATDPMVLRDAAEALVDLHLLRGEREQAIATLNDLRLRTKDRGLLDWIDQRLKEIAGE